MYIHLFFAISHSDPPFFLVGKGELADTSVSVFVFCLATTRQGVLCYHSGAGGGKGRVLGSWIYHGICLETGIEGVGEISKNFFTWPG